MDSILQAMLGCSVDQADTFISVYRGENGWHAETVIGAAGALVGHAIQSSAYSMAAQGTGAVSEFERMTNPPFGKFVNCNEPLQLFIDNELACLRRTSRPSSTGSARMRGPIWSRSWRRATIRSAGSGFLG